jgi:hypothetical protein
VVGPIEILPPLSSPAADAARRVPLDPIAPAGAADERRGHATPRPLPVDVVFEIDTARDARPRPEGAAGAASRHRGGRRPLPYPPGPEGRRSPFAASAAGAADRPVPRDAGALAYRSADGLIADYAHRGTFLDLSV